MYAEVVYMTIMEMLGQSSVLAVLGMAVVFAFLWIMVVCVSLTGKIVKKMGLDKDLKKPGYTGPVSTGTPPQVAAAITAAVTEYQKDESQK